MADMQGEGAKIFRQSAMSRIASADDLDKYIRVTNPSAWMVLIAGLLFIGGLLVWSLTAFIPINVNTTGVVMDGKVKCFVDKDTADKISFGNSYATVEGERAKSVEVDSQPKSWYEINAELESDYLIDALKIEDWGYVVTITMENADSLSKSLDLVPVVITVSENRPIDLVVGKS